MGSAVECVVSVGVKGEASSSGKIRIVMAGKEGESEGMFGTANHVGKIGSPLLLLFPVWTFSQSPADPRPPNIIII